MTEYLLNRTWEPELRRLKLQQEYLDPITTDHLTRIGVAEGWRCLEVGAGAGSIAHWMAERVGNSGQVLAIDLDTTPIQGLNEPNLQVRQLDLMAEELPTGFDLVHFRLLVGHLPDPDEGLRRIYSAVRPGGWLLAEESDSLWALIDDPPTWPAQAQELRAKVTGALVRLWKDTGYDPWWGRNLLSKLCELGLENLGGEVRSPLLQGRFAEVALLSAERFRDQLIDRGDITSEDYEAWVQTMKHPDWKTFLYFLTAVWGQKPPA
jgi:SAM-dependent methyltransferase